MRITDLFTNEGDFPDFDFDAAVLRLSQAVQCRTISDPEDYVEFDKLQALIRESYPVLMSSGTFELIGHSVLITIPGSDAELRPALFMSHQDVVPIVAGTEENWTHAPFSGEISDGFIWGRGTLDIKQQVFGTLEAVEYLLKKGHRFRRTVFLAFGEDEETFNSGSRAIAKVLAERGHALEFLLDEGGGTIVDGSVFGAPNINLVQIDLMEKGYADLELSVRSTGGHSSRPFGGTSLGRLSGAIAAVVSSPFPSELPLPLRKALSVLKPYITEQPLRELIQDIDGNSQAIADYCTKDRALFPFVTTTIAPTMISGGSAACNVMPQDMRAVINFRIAAGHTADEVMEHCRAVISDPEVSLRFLQANDPSEIARTDTAAYGELVKAMGHYYDSVVFVPAMTVGATDARSYEPICDTCLRCSPFLSDPAIVKSGVHGTDERISLRSYAQGIRVLIRLINTTCGEETRV